MIIKGGTLIDGTGASLITDAAIFIKDSKIKKIGTSDDVKPSTEKKIIDATGKTILPGLIEMHVHPLSIGHSSKPTDRYFAPNSLKLLYAVKNLNEMLENGYTTVRIMHGNLLEQDPRGRVLVSLRTAIERGVIRGPRIFVPGLLKQTAGHVDLYVPKTWPRGPYSTADGVNEVRKLTRQCLREGVDWIKILGTTGGGSGSWLNHPKHRNYTLEELNVIVEEAHALGTRVATHSHGGIGLFNAIVAGADTIEHGMFLNEEKEGMKLMVEKGQFLIPTLTTLLHPDGYLARGERGEIPKDTYEKTLWMSENGIESFKAAYKAGVKIAAGTDFRHTDSAYELMLYVKFGMSPMEAIQTATRNAAEALGRSNDIGTIEAGKSADIIVVDGNPLENIEILQNQEKIKYVIKEGKVFVE
jgi:imidazolonepropionase-like amidohydrolase